MTSLLLEKLDALFLWVVQTSWRASVLAGLVLLSQWLFRRWLSPRWVYRLWFIPLLCLLIPSAPQSSFSIFNLLGTPSYALGTPSNTVPTIPVSGRPAAAAAPASDVLPSNAPAVRPQAASQAANASAAGRAISPVFLLQMLWLGGFLFLTLRFLVSNMAFSASIARIRPSEHPDLLALLEECKKAMGVHARVEIIRAPQICSPVLMGIFKPKLLLPRNPPEPFSHQELRYIFLHELAHLKQGDIAINWLTTFAQTLHWFNPVVWFALSRMRAEREVARDHLAISYAGGKGNQSYGLTILKILQNLPPRPESLPALSGMLETKYQLKHRFSMIAGFRRTRPAWAALSALLVSALAVTGLTVARETSPLELPPLPESVEAAQQRKTVALWLEGKLKRKLGTIYLREMEFQETPIEQAAFLLSEAAMDADPEQLGVTIYVLPGSKQTVTLKVPAMASLDHALAELSTVSRMRFRVDEFQECVLLEPESIADSFDADLRGYAMERSTDEFLEPALAFPTDLSSAYLSDERRKDGFPREDKLESLFPEEEKKPEPPKSILTNRGLSNQKKDKPSPWPEL